MKKIVTMVLFAFGFALIANADVLPPGTEYVAPDGGEIRLDEAYGSNNAGQGTWTGSTLTIQPDTLSHEVTGWDPAETPIGNVFGYSSMVVDLCFEWTSTVEGTGYAAQFYIGNSTRRSLFTLQGNGQFAGIDVEESTLTVLRFVTDDNFANVTVINGLNGESVEVASSATGESGLKVSNLSTLTGITTDLDYSWIKAYRNVADFSAPLAAVPEPMTMSVLAVGGIFTIIRKKR